jgi:nucleoside-diphosphate kinase
MERSFCMIKPDGVMRRLAGDVIGRIEKKGLRIAGLKMISMSQEQVSKLYKVHEGKSFYSKLVKFVTSGPVIVMVVEGHEAVKALRNLLGATTGYEAAPGTIRGDYGLSRGKNVIHGSDSVESAQYEIPIFFKDSELARYVQPDLDWCLEPDERGKE